MRPALRAAAVLIFALLAAACSTTRLTSTWVEPGRDHAPFNDLIVFGMAANERVRRVYEDSFVAALQARGVKARPGYSLIPEGGLGKVKAVREAVSLSGADGVIVTYLAGQNSETAQVPRRNYVTPSLYGGLYPYYGLVYDNVTEPGYYARFKLLQLETNVYDAERQRLLWSGRSQTLDPSSEQTTINEVVGLVIDSLARAGFLRP